MRAKLDRREAGVFVSSAKLEGLIVHEFFKAEA
jgi:hypothetical protein